MTTLTRFDQDGIELVIDTATGAAYTTQSGYARMSGLSQQAINKRCKGYNQDELQSAEVDLGYGLQGYNLIPAKLVYRWLVKDNPELGFAMGEAGATIYLHQLAGYKVSSSAIVPQPQPLQLPPADVRISNLIDALGKIGFDMQSPRFNQGLKDLTGDILGFGRSALNAATIETWCGVAERAEQLGYPVGEVTKKRSQLGKWVARGGLLKKQEARLCNGTQRSVNLYLVGDELDSRINSFFGKA